jgi:serine/threonine-protein phosphatase 2A regulatory subunit B
MNVTGKNLERLSTADKLTSLSVPTLTPVTRIPASTCKQVFADAHAYNINSISPNSDCETFISTDDLRINLWNLERSDQSFSMFKITFAFFF